MERLLTLALVLFVVPASAQDSTAKQSNAFTWNAYVEGYYSYDFNKPADGNRPRFIYSHNRHNEFNVNLAFVKASYVDDRVRANIALGVGTYMNANYAAENGVLKNIYEANAGYKLSRSRNIWFDIGILPSHIGFEGPVSKDCWTVTRSIGAENTPYYEAGARVTYTTADSKWLLSALVLNGWQRIARVNGNSLMSWGTQVQYKASDRVLINYSSFLGTDRPDSARLWRYFHNLYGIFQLSGQFGITAGFDVGQEQRSKGSPVMNVWYAPLVIVRVTPVDKWALAVRGEYYDDEKGVIVAAGQPGGFDSFGYSVNLDYMPGNKVALRLEARSFRSRENVFPKGTGFTDKSTCITFSTAISF